jgi:hypothetical protein
VIKRANIKVDEVNFASTPLYKKKTTSSLARVVFFCSLTN